MGRMVCFFYTARHVMQAPIRPRVLRRRSFFLAVLAAVAGVVGFSSFSAQAEPARFPNKPVRLVVPYPPGGTADILARDIGARLGAELGQSVVIENRAGAGTAIGARYVSRAPSDGYTLFLGTSTSHVMNPAVNAEGVGYDPVRDFTPLAAIGEVPYVIVTTPGKEMDSLDALVSRAAASEKPLAYASAGTGSANHLAGELLERLTGISLTHVPYKGSAPALNDVLAGQVDFMFDLTTTSKAHIEAGRLVPLGVTAAQRSRALPDVPTTAELGRSDLVLTSWFGLFAPAALPEDVAATLTIALEKVLSDEGVRVTLGRQGLSVLPLFAADFGVFLRRDLGYWQGVVRAAHVAING